jgi:hypothetical protein
MAQVQVGMRLKSTVSDLMVIVIRPGKGLAIESLECAGAPMAPLDAEVSAQGQPGSADAVEVPVGKRYASESDHLELLVTRGGLGPLTISGRALEIEQPKKLPSSD